MMTAPDDTGPHKIRARVEQSLRPMTLPNFITFLRMAMIPFFVLAVNGHEFQLAALIFVLAGVTDAMDGAIARSFHQESLFGTYLDPIADKLLLSTAYIALTIPQGQAVVIPLWLTIMALFRDSMIVIVALMLFVAAGIRRFKPSIWGKMTTFMHVATVTLVLIANIRAVPGWLLSAFFYVSFGFVILSGFNYIYRASKMLAATEERE